MVLQHVESTATGLSAAESARRLLRDGPNALPEGKPRTLLSMVLGQFTDFLVLLLIGAAVVAGALGDVSDTLAIIVIIVLNAVIGVVQERRAQKAMEALRQLAGDTATVLRDGQAATVPAVELAVGDVVLLDAGRVVPADVRLIEVANLRVAEAALTGESLPVDKQVAPVVEPDAPVGDRKSMGFKGTQVVHGRGRGVVTAVGLGTELGHIATLLAKSGDEKTPLQKRLAQFGRMLGVVALGLCALVFAIGVLRGEPVLLMFMTAVSLAVAAVPEALPAVSTVALALGARRLVKAHTLVRRLPAVETLGSVTFICSDKTGTLTLNRMAVERVCASGEEAEALPKGAAATGSAVHWLAMSCALSNDVEPSPEGLAGDPTEVALVEAAEAAGFAMQALTLAHPRVAEAPFDSDRKRMSTVHRLPDGRHVILCKGAVESLAPCLVNQLAASGQPEALDLGQVTQRAEGWAAKGLRVLAFGLRVVDAVPADASAEALEQGLSLVGLVGLVDPPRPESEGAVRQCLAAGITPVMVTGDHPATALAIARRLGIATDAGQMLTGGELSKLSKAEFAKRVRDVRVYARVAPAQKLQIVEALQTNGEFVGMTGDGVNDAPALAKADIGIAMGITGTDVAREAAAMVLLDDNFASIVQAVREGRRIFDNIRKFIKYTMTSNAGEVWPILLAPLFGLPVPLLPIHILWVNLVTDGLPGLALSVEPPEAGIMERPPRPPKESLFADGLATHLVWVGLLMGGATLATQAWALHEGLHWQTMVFTVLCLSQMGHALAVRSDRQSLFTQGLLTNPQLLGAVLLTFVLQLAVTYVPVLQGIFKTEALTLQEFGIALAVSSVVFWAVEAEKWVKRQRDARRRSVVDSAA